LTGATGSGAKMSDQTTSAEGNGARAKRATISTFTLK